MKHFISLGAGRQSSAIAMMAAAGEITPMPDCAIFADTGWEPKAVYDWLDWLEKQLPFPVHRVSAGDLWQSATRVRRTRDGKRTYISTGIPIFIATNDGASLTVRKGIGKRQCTRTFKIEPVNRKVKELCGLKRARRGMSPLASVWIGISADEAHRAKLSPFPWIERRHPLLELDMDADDCIRWFTDRGFPSPPRSACVFCPFRDDDSWLALTPDELASVAVMEGQMQRAYAQTSEFKGKPYFHDSLKPIGEVKFIAKPKTTMRQQRLFSAECEGFCGR